MDVIENESLKAEKYEKDDRNSCRIIIFDGDGSSARLCRIGSIHEKVLSELESRLSRTNGLC